jgi:hypothetical protein
VSLLFDLQIGDPAFRICNYWLELQRFAKQAEQIAWRTDCAKLIFLNELAESACLMIAMGHELPSTDVLRHVRSAPNFRNYAAARQMQRGASSDQNAAQQHAAPDQPGRPKHARID